MTVGVLAPVLPGDRGGGLLGRFSSRRAILPGVLPIYDGVMNDTETSLRAENAELRRLLDKHQWAGLTPVKSAGCCPECCGASPPRGRGHRPGCAIAAILVVTAPSPGYL